jgi:hypothetical protein
LLKKSPLIPKKAGQLLNYETWDAHTSEEHKWEFYDGKPFNPHNTYEAERLMIALTYYCGLERFVELLPNQSKVELLELLKIENEKERN